MNFKKLCTKLFAVGLSFVLCISMLSLSNIEAHASEGVYEFGTEKTVLEPGVYSVPIKMKKANDVNKNSMAGSALPETGELKVERDGTATLKVGFQPVSVLFIKGYAEAIKYYEGTALTDEFKRDATVLSTYEENGKPKDVLFPILDKSTNGFFMNMYVAAMMSSPDAYVAIDYPRAQKTADLDPQAGSEESGENDSLTPDTKPEEGTGDVSEDNNTPVPATEKLDSEKYVKLNIGALSVTGVQMNRMLDPYAKLIEKEGKKYLRIYFFSKQKYGPADDPNAYDRGSEDVWYSFDAPPKKGYNFDYSSFTKLDTKKLEEGKIIGDYEFSTADIPVGDNTKVYIAGAFPSVANGPRIQHGSLVTWEDTDLNDANISFKAPQLLLVHQESFRTKDDTEKELPFDFQRDGVKYSPYNSKDGTKYRLNTGSFSTSIDFAKDSFIFSELRHIKYTLDGSEPTMDSNEATIKAQNKHRFLPDSFFRISLAYDHIAPFVTAKGGEVTVKVKGFNADGSKSSDTLTYVVPYEAQGIDETQPTIVDVMQMAVIGDTNRNYVLYDDTVMKYDDTVAEEVKNKIQEQAAEKGLTDIKIMKLSFVNKNGDPAELMYADGWEEEAFPRANITLKNSGGSKDWRNSTAYKYAYGRLTPIKVSRRADSLKIEAYSPEGYYVIGTQNAAKRKSEAQKFYEAAMARAEEIKNQNTVSAIKAKGVVEEAKSKPSKSEIKYMEFATKINAYVDKALLEMENKDDFAIQEAKDLINIINNPLTSKILSEDTVKLLNEAKTELEEQINKNDMQALENAVEKTRNVLENRKYSLPYYSGEINILRQDSDDMSMASGVFDKKAQLLIGKDGKRYLVTSMKPMSVVGITAHLLELSVYQNELDSDKYPVTRLSNFTDINDENKKQLFDKLLVIELPDEEKDTYYIRVDNDGMKGAKPAARMKLVFNRESLINDKDETAEPVPVEPTPEAPDKPTPLPTDPETPNPVPEEPVSEDTKPAPPSEEAAPAPGKPAPVEPNGKSDSKYEASTTGNSIQLKDKSNEKPKDKNSVPQTGDDNEWSVLIITIVMSLVAIGMINRKTNSR